MLDGPAVVSAFRTCGVTDVVWIPDTFLGTWEAALETAPDLRLIRVCREGEALAVGAGLLLGGRQPVVIVQCTGFFEAGDALRNLVHDLELPLFLIIGLRGQLDAMKGKHDDTCPQFSEPIVKAWRLPYVLLDDKATGADLVTAFQQARAEKRPGAVLVAE